MADEPAGGEEPQKNEDPEGGEEPAKGKEQTPPWGSDEEFDPKRAWKLIQDVRSDAEKAKADRETLQEKVKQHEDAAKTDQQKLEDRASTAERRATETEREAARLRVALRKGLTETQAKRLVGDSEEDLEKDADELLASFRTEDDEGQEPRRRPQERLRPGATPASEPEEKDPRKLAEGLPKHY